MHLHSSFSLVALSGEEPHPNDKAGENEPLFSDVGSPRRLRRHEPRRGEVVPESAFAFLFFFGCAFRERTTSERWGRGRTNRYSRMSVRPIAQQWHEERSDEVAPESAHSPQGVSFVVASPRRRRHEEHRDEVVPESAPPPRTKPRKSAPSAEHPFLYPRIKSPFRP